MSRERTSPIRRGKSHVEALSGVKPRPRKGAQNLASSAAMVKSAARARDKPIPAAHPCTSHTIGVCVRNISEISRFAWFGNRRWILPTLGRVSPGAFRATMSNPEQKSSPEPPRTITRTDSSFPAATSSSINPDTMSSVNAFRFSGRSMVRRSTPEWRSTSSPGMFKSLSSIPLP